MEKVVSASLEGNLSDLFASAVREDKDTQRYVHNAIAGRLSDAESMKTSFLLPAADNKGEVCFTSREVLTRFTGLRIERQAAFLRTIRQAMNEAGVSEMKLSVVWSATKSRTLSITRSDDHPDAYLRIRLL
jgi:hypothetical protein